jgi:hypothetical protein
MVDLDQGHQRSLTYFWLLDSDWLTIGDNLRTVGRILMLFNMHTYLMDTAIRITAEQILRIYNEAAGL